MKRHRWTTLNLLAGLWIVAPPAFSAQEPRPAPRTEPADRERRAEQGRQERERKSETRRQEQARRAEERRRVRERRAEERRRNRERRAEERRKRLILKEPLVHQR